MAVVSKSDVIKKVAEKTGKSAKDTTEIITALLDAIRESLGEGDDVRLIGFGSFTAGMSAERTGVNPKTREKITIPAKTRVKFSAGKELADSIAAKKG